MFDVFVNRQVKQTHLFENLNYFVKSIKFGLKLMPRQDIDRERETEIERARERGGERRERHGP